MSEIPIREWYAREGARRFSARDAMVCVFVCALVLLALEGPTIERAGERMDDGPTRTAVLAVGRPAAWVGEKTGLSDISHDATAWLSPDDDLGSDNGFAAASAPVLEEGRQLPVTPDAFDPAALGDEPAAPARELRTLLVTGDSLSTPLDTEMARRLAGESGIRTVRDPHLGTGISKSLLVDWGTLSAEQVKDDRPDAVVVFIGANEGFPMEGPEGKDVECCGPDWAAVYATRVRRMMETYRQKGAGRVYWLTLPAPRDADLQRVAKTVNAAIYAAAAPYRAQVRVLDMNPIFTPGFKYRDAMEVDGRKQIVRESDGIHLNGVGVKPAADAVLNALRRDFKL